MLQNLTFELEVVLIEKSDILRTGHTLRYGLA
jgi:hypothetical protein